MSTNIYAGTEEPNIKVLGLGGTKCEIFTSIVDENIPGKINVYKVWLSGYMSSYSAFITLYGKEIKDIDTSVVVNDLYPICKKDSSEVFVNALSSIINNYVNTEASHTKYSGSEFVKNLCEKVLPKKTANK